MEDYFYRDKSGKEIGPIPLTTLAQLRSAGVLDAETPVRIANSEKWVPCREVVAVSAPSAPPPASARTGKSSLPPALVILSIIGAVIYAGSVLYKSVAAMTTLTYGFSLDGKEIPKGETPEVKVDGQLFESGNHLKPGRHQISISVENVEPNEKHFWVFHGNKDLGALPLESSKGALSVTVNPSSAKLILQRKGEVVRESDSPLNQDKLIVGDYSLICTIGKNFSADRVVKIRRNETTRLDIKAELGDIAMEAEPGEADYSLISGTGKTWSGRTPATLKGLSTGSYLLSMKRGDYEKSTNIVVHSFAITRAKLLFEYGKMEIQSNPAGATVFEGNREMGRTPLVLSDLRPGTYSYRLTLNDYADASVSAVVVGNETRVVETNLVSLKYTQAMQNARDYLRSANFTDALKGVEFALEIKPADELAAALRSEIFFNIHYSNAANYFARDQFDEALKELDEANKLIPDNAEVITLRNRISQKMEGRLDYLVRNGEMSLANGRLDDASRDLGEATQIHPADQRVIELRGKIQAAQYRRARIEEWKRLLNDINDPLSFKSYLWKFRIGFPAAHDGTLQALKDLSSTWTIKSEDLPDDKTSILQLEAKGLLFSAGFGLLMVSQPADGVVEVRSKMWLTDKRLGILSTREDESARRQRHAGWVRDLDNQLKAHIGVPFE